MSDQQLEGLGNIGLQNIRHSSVDIHQYIGKSLDYRQLADRLSELQELQSLYTNNPEKRQEYGKKVSEQEKMIEAFKADVVRLAETFKDIDMYSGSMVRAKELFEEGKFREADTMLNAADLQQEQDKLLQNKERLNTALRNNANAFLVKAQSTALDFNNPDRFSLAVQYFESSLAADKNTANLSAYIDFLCKHNKLSKAFPYAKEAVNIARSAGAYTLAESLLNLGKIYYDWNKLEEAETTLREGLETIRSIYNEDRRKYFILLMLLHDALGVLYYKTGQWKEAEESLNHQVKMYESVLDTNPAYYEFYLTNAQYKLLIVRTEQQPFAEVKKDLAAFADTLRKQTGNGPGYTKGYLFSLLSNIVLLFHRNREYKQALALSAECLDICREEVRLNREAMLPGMGKALSRHADILTNLGDRSAALENYLQAEAIFTELVKDEQEEFQDYYARTLEGISKSEVFFKHFEKAEEKLLAALNIRMEMCRKNRKLFLSDLAITTKEYAALKLKSEQAEEALTLYREAEEMLTEVVQQTPGKYDTYLADCFFGYGLCYNQLGNLELSAANLEKCADIKRPLLEASPDRDYFLSFGTCLYNIALLYTHHIINRTKALKYLREIIDKNNRYGFDEKEGALFDLITDTAVLLIVWDKRGS